MATPVTDIQFKKDDFNTTLSIVALVIPAKLCNDYLKKFDSSLFDRPRMKRIYNTPDNDSNKRLLLMHERFTSPDQISEDLRAFHESNGLGTATHEVSLTYDHLSVEEILKRLFAKHGVVLQEIPSSYEQAGHVAHVNLREDALPYKHLVGQVILQKNRKTIRSVVNKVASIDTVYRTFPLEVIAGDGDLNVDLKESGARFSFNFAEVYWNSRLQAEHIRLIQKICHRSSASAGAGPYVVADMMAGVGPFAVPLAMQIHGSSKTKKVFVHANDLNPASFKYLTGNIKTNHCAHSLRPYNLDAREFIVEELLGKQRVVFEETIMNLPQNATDFLDAFIGLSQRYRRLGLVGADQAALLPLINVYAFSTADEPVQDIVQRCATVLQCQPRDLLESGMCDGHIVRDVAPKKVMVCLSFRLPVSVADAEPPVFPFESRKRSAAALGEDL